MKKNLKYLFVLLCAIFCFCLCLCVKWQFFDPVMYNVDYSYTTEEENDYKDISETISVRFNKNGKITVTKKTVYNDKIINFTNTDIQKEYGFYIIGGKEENYKILYTMFPVYNNYNKTTSIACDRYFISNDKTELMKYIESEENFVAKYNRNLILWIFCGILIISNCAIGYFAFKKDGE